MRPQCTLESGSESERASERERERAAVCWGEKRHYGVMKNEKALLFPHTENEREKRKKKIEWGGC